MPTLRRSLWFSCRHRGGILVVATIAGLSCSIRRAPTVPPVDEPPVSGPVYDFEAEAQAPAHPVVQREPAGATARAAKLETPPAELERRAVSVQDLDPSAPAAEPDVASTGPGVQGYRAQVFAGTREETARRVAGQVVADVDAPAYVEVQPPYYKVRVGNCETRRACDELRSRLHRAGYDAVWIVPSTIEP